VFLQLYSVETDMHNPEYLGFAAGMLTTLAFLPQAVRMLKTKRTRDISLLWAIAMNAGTLLWLTYGIVKNDLPMITANSISLVLLIVILISRLRYR
jgi:MtN3 and saliva related transmembrane protein